MKQALFQMGHWLLHALGLLVLISLQSSLWPLLLGPFPPLLWIVPLVYFATYYPLLPAYFYVFSLALLASFASSAAPFVPVFSLGVLTALMAYLRKRIFWEGPSYLALTVILAALLYPPLTWLASSLSEAHPMAYPRPLAWVFQVLLTPWVAFAFFGAFRRLDQIFLSESMFRSSRGAIAE